MTRLTAAWSAIRANRLFATALLLGLALRVVTMLGYPPAIWFGGDSASYLSTALRHSPGTSRVSGYGLMLLVLRPFHSFEAVTAVQHLMGLAIAVMLYAVARRHAVPGWVAALAALPVLLSAYQVQLEQEVLPSAAFEFAVVVALTLTLWWCYDRPGWASAAAAGTLAASATLWPVGLPMLVLYLGYLAFRQVGWRVLAASAALGAIPLVGYLAWFDHTYHHVAFTESDGVYLWSRTLSFANCAVIHPPADQRVLCPNQPVARRPAASTFIWEKNSPLDRLPGKKFSSRNNALAMDFALHAIAAQPGGYLASVAHDVALSFAWDIPPHPSAAMAHRYEFGYATTPWISPSYLVTPHHTVASDQFAYGGVSATRAVQPFAGWLVTYQRYIYLRGTLLGVVLLTGLAGIARSWREGGIRRRTGWGGPGLYPCLASLALLVVPVMTADYSLRYTLIAIAPTCLAAALTFAERPDGPLPASLRAEPAAGTTVLEHELGLS